MRFLMFMAVFLCAALPGAQAYQAKVVEIVDGDTIVVETTDNEQRLINLADIDAPELKQPAGEDAKNFLSALIKDKIVSIDSSNGDTTNVCLDGANIGWKMVIEGYAWCDENKPSMYKQLRRAKKARKGLWAQGTPVSPALWRKANNVSDGPPITISKATTSSIANNQFRRELLMRDDPAAYEKLLAEEQLAADRDNEQQRLDDLRAKQEKYENKKKKNTSTTRPNTKISTTSRSFK